MTQDYYGPTQIDALIFKDSWITEKPTLRPKAPINNTDDSLFLKDIAQSRCFTVTLSGFPQFKLPNGSYSEFLPVKNINYSFTSYDNMSIPLLMFGDFPLLQRKKISTIQLTCYDTDDDQVEKAVRAWESSCTIKGCANYLSNIAKTFTYKSYDVKGKLNTESARTLYVIPTGSVGVNRGYDDNNEKTVTFQVAAVGGPGASAKGNGSLSDPTKVTVAQQTIVGVGSSGGGGGSW